jgi:hypothetical protein
MQNWLGEADAFTITREENLFKSGHLEGRHGHRRIILNGILGEQDQIQLVQGRVQRWAFVFSHIEISGYDTRFSHVMWVPVTTAGGVIGLRVEETASGFWG